MRCGQFSENSLNGRNSNKWLKIRKKYLVDFFSIPRIPVLAVNIIARNIIVLFLFLWITFKEFLQPRQCHLIRVPLKFFAASTKLKYESSK